MVGDKTLDLAGRTLDIRAAGHGVDLAPGARLTVLDSRGTGRLVVAAGGSGAAVHVVDAHLVVNGAVVQADAGASCAAVGACPGETAGTVEVRAGTLLADASAPGPGGADGGSPTPDPPLPGPSGLPDPPPSDAEDPTPAQEATPASFTRDRRVAGPAAAGGGSGVASAGLQVALARSAPGTEVSGAGGALGIGAAPGDPPGQGAALVVGPGAIVVAGGTRAGLALRSLEDAGTLNLAPGSAWSIAAGTSMRISGALTVSGKVDNAGAIVNAGALTLDGASTNTGHIHNSGTIGGAGSLRNDGIVSGRAPNLPVTGHDYELVWDAETGKTGSDAPRRVLAPTLEAAGLAVPVPEAGRGRATTFLSWHTDTGGELTELTSLRALAGRDGPVTVKLRAVWGEPPTWVGAEPATPQVGVPYTDGVLARGEGTVTYEVTSGSLPAGLSLDRHLGSITGTATKAGTYTAKITADNGVEPQAVRTLRWTVAPARALSIRPAGQLHPGQQVTVTGRHFVGLESLELLVDTSPGLRAHVTSLSQDGAFTARLTLPDSSTSGSFRLEARLEGRLLATGPILNIRVPPPSTGPAPTSTPSAPAPAVTAVAAPGPPASTSDDAARARVISLLVLLLAVLAAVPLLLLLRSRTRPRTAAGPAAGGPPAVPSTGARPVLGAATPGRRTPTDPAPGTPPADPDAGAAAAGPLPQAPAAGPVLRIPAAGLFRPVEPPPISRPTATVTRVGPEGTRAPGSSPVPGPPSQGPPAPGSPGEGPEEPETLRR